MKEKTTFKRLLRTPQSSKKEAPAGDAQIAAADSPGELKKQPEIYTDLSVCKVLGIRRRVLADARTAATRGRDWDAIGEEVGMTRAWIEDLALEFGLVPDFLDELERVSGRFTSVRLIGTTPNLTLVQVELEANKKREFARTRNIITYPIHYKEVFSCIRVPMAADMHLEWIAAPNDMKY